MKAAYDLLWRDRFAPPSLSLTEALTDRERAVVWNSLTIQVFGSAAVPMEEPRLIDDPSQGTLGPVDEADRYLLNFHHHDMIVVRDGRIVDLRPGKWCTRAPVYWLDVTDAERPVSKKGSIKLKGTAGEEGEVEVDLDRGGDMAIKSVRTAKEANRDEDPHMVIYISKGREVKRWRMAISEEGGLRDWQAVHEWEELSSAHFLGEGVFAADLLALTHPRSGLVEAIKGGSFDTTNMEDAGYHAVPLPFVFKNVSAGDRTFRSPYGEAGGPTCSVPPAFPVQGAIDPQVFSACKLTASDTVAAPAYLIFGVPVWQEGTQWIYNDALFAVMPSRGGNSREYRFVHLPRTLAESPERWPRIEFEHDTGRTFISEEI
jgi:hypothetical protein